MSDMDRKAFEAWVWDSDDARRAPEACRDEWLARDGNGAYLDWTTRSAYSAWQAATRAERERCRMSCIGRAQHIEMICAEPGDGSVSPERKREWEHAAKVLREVAEEIRRGGE